MEVYLTKATELLGRSELDLGERNALSLYVSELDGYYTSENLKYNIRNYILGVGLNDIRTDQE